jgi:hypothetical protein
MCAAIRAYRFNDFSAERNFDMLVLLTGAPRGLLLRAQPRGTQAITDAASSGFGPKPGTLSWIISSEPLAS